MNHVAFIGFASGWGAQVRETEKGPDALKKASSFDILKMSWTWKETIYPKKSSQEISLPPGILTLPYIQDICLRIAKSVRDTLNTDQFPVVIGGDHVVAAGTWAGVANALKAKENFGLIWIDAHMDAHTMETTPSQAYHGMPLAALLGFGEESLVNILEKGPILNPQHLSLIGIRSYEEGEEALLKRLGVRIYYMEEVRERGFKVVFQEALERAKNKTKGFGLSIDLDAFDPMEAPGVGTPASNGLTIQEVLPELLKVQNDSELKALEVVEFNPDRDKNDKTLTLLKDLLINLLPNERKNI